MTLVGITTGTMFLEKNRFTELDTDLTNYTQLLLRMTMTQNSAVVV